MPQKQPPASTATERDVGGTFATGGVLAGRAALAAGDAGPTEFASGTGVTAGGSPRQANANATSMTDQPP